jgi:hypothetical protein
MFTINKPICKKLKFKIETPYRNIQHTTVRSLISTVTTQLLPRNCYHATVTAQLLPLNCYHATVTALSVMTDFYVPQHNVQLKCECLKSNGAYCGCNTKYMFVSVHLTDPFVKYSCGRHMRQLVNIHYNTHEFFIKQKVGVKWCIVTKQMFMNQHTNTPYKHSPTSTQSYNLHNEIGEIRRIIIQQHNQLIESQKRDSKKMFWFALLCLLVIPFLQKL